VWRPRGELQESLFVGLAATALSLVILLGVAPQALHGVLPPRLESFTKRAMQVEFGTLLSAQQRYFAEHGRYAEALEDLPWRTGYNLYVRVREADSAGFRVTASTSGPDALSCELSVRQQADATQPRSEQRVACRVAGR
jgi:hypothetical protein